MLPAAFISQIQQRFSHEKRARVCLWFDPAGEFVRLLPVLQDHLAKMKSPPFHLLAYDPQQKHGQLWLKRQTWTKRDEGPGRFLYYLPLPEERLHSSDESGRHYLELLTEFTIAGIDWKVGGKRPTLFNFLKTAGVALPTDSSAQRKLTEGGADSLLGKYAAKFANRPPVFWEETVTPELAQTRLVGDVDQTILDLAVDPETKWQDLTQAGNLEEFLASVRERLGISPNTDNPTLWIKSLIESLALTEAFVGYGEAQDFPFADRLPPSRFRESQVSLVRRWLRDANCRGAWDRWVVDAEGHINLSNWAKNKDGAAYGFPHLVTSRWEKAIDSLGYSASERASMVTRVAEMAPDIQREAEFSKASDTAPGHWETLLGFSKYVQAVERGRKLAEAVASTPECLRVYLDLAEAVDGAHLHLKAEAQERGLSDLAKLVDRLYGDYAKLLNQRFFDLYSASESSDIPGLPFVTTHLDSFVWSAGGKRAVIIIDALRYDCALRLKGLLSGCDVTIEPMRSILPTVTPFGMSALLPSACQPTGLLEKTNMRVPERDGVDLGDRKNRLELLRHHGADCREIEDVEGLSTKPAKLSPLLVIFGHEEVDHIGHGSADALLRHLDKELDRIARLVRKLHAWGYAKVNIVTDHGFILLDEENLPEEVTIKKEWTVVLKERYALVPSDADLPLKSKPIPWDPTLRVAPSPGMAFFKTEKSFSHGGATLQEMIIPRLVSKQRTSEKKVGVEILLSGAGANLSTAAVKVILRPLAAAPEGEMELITASPRNLILNVFQTEKKKLSVLPKGEPKTIQLQASGEATMTLFFDSRFAIQKGGQLQLVVTDADTGEHFPGPEGIILTAARTI
jgi:hypothetical protein